MKPLPATSPRPVSTRSALGLHGGISLLALGCVASMLAACGGSPGAEIVEVYDCVLTNCKDSELLSTDALSPHAVIRGEGNVLNISAQLGQSANLLTRVRLTGADRFFAQTSSQRIELRDSDGKGSSYTGSLTVSAEEPSLSIVLERRGEQHVNSVTLPKSFSVLAPVGPVNLGLKTGKLMVNLGHASGSSVDNLSSLRCTRKDGSSFSGGRSDNYSLPFVIENVNGSPWVRINTADLDLSLNQHSSSLDTNAPNTSPVQTCEIAVSWRVYRMGSTASTLSRHSTVRGERAASQSISYDARL
ncbi:hypothetical protein [Kinneretia aquatilis]|uniref:hypothetical protein n=1 Tax=Kinneretia aquatilis TaxID=2070761 RepID=UPI0014952B7D|nr:hypothetical protein [Paucibacter aquatile]WIV98306.1 hypothetical protein K9V56_002000 [Paucibacter aquatile]